jgi:hypothetical protein
VIGLADRVKPLIPRSVLRRLVRARLRLRSPTSRFRVLPDFLIIGAQRGGTSSLYKYLEGHPSIVASVRKEVEYFSRRYSLGLSWYRSHFPTRVRKAYLEGIRRGKILTFEATPDYLFLPTAAARAAEVVPDAKIVVLLRNPTDRAFSHYQHMVRLGFESLSFEDAISAESARLADDVQRIREDPFYDCRNYRRFSYVSRGIYIDQLEVWMAHFARDRFLILKSEDFFADPARVYREVLSFLNLAPWEPSEFLKYNYPRGRALRERHLARPSAFGEAARHMLVELFRPHNESLYAYLGRDFGWEQ